VNQIVENRPTETVLETNFGNEAQIEYVAYGLLCRSPSNVRKKAPTGIEELAITIEAKGLMQNLVAHAIKGSRAKQPKLGVCAGQRRLAALDLLFAQGKITKDHPVPVKVVSEAEAVAASLLENQHEPMHPADQCEAFRMLAEEGKSIEYIALFSAAPVTVRRRMKLANISPKLLALLREDAITLDQLSALALADDHETQERIWFDANEWQRQPNYLRQAITRIEIDARRSRLVRFVGLDAYEAEGGYVRRDLLSDDENAGYIADAELLQRLAAAKLDAAAEKVRAEGWRWTEQRIERDVFELNATAGCNRCSAPLPMRNSGQWMHSPRSRTNWPKSSKRCRRTTRMRTRKPNASKPTSTGSTLPSSRLKAARRRGTRSRWPKLAHS
jgi:ParB family chromosome partitioning protein